MITLIAEKPSVGMELARITGCRTRQEGYMEGGRLNGDACRVTWAIGHLCQLDEDEATKALHWKRENLPVLPERFGLSPRLGKDRKPDPGYVKQLNVIQKLFAETDVIVNCGDAGREGEVIQRWILDYVIGRNPKCNKPVKRLWISSMTDEAIRAGLSNLMPGADFDPLYLAGKARAEADWLVGINATEALTLKANLKDMNGRNKVLSLGRVQTPTMALVCERYLENKNFKPTPFWTVRLATEGKGMPFTIVSDKRFDSFGEAESVTKRASVSMIEVVEAGHKPKVVQPPLLHDQTSLQQEASRRYDLSPDDTLATVQKLYEMKLVTYPRTGSRFIPKDVLNTIPDRIKALASASKDPAIRSAATAMSSLSAGQLGRRSVNDNKVTDHHALLVEKTVPPDLGGRELKIYNLIAERMLEAFGAPCECDVFSVKFTCAGEGFSASSTHIVKAGWKAVRGAEAPAEPDKKSGDDEGQPEQKLPDLAPGDKLPVKKAETVQGQTKPKPLYTYESLLEAMKTAGKDSDDDEVKAALKEIGIGTAATRASILKILLDVRRYIKKDGKKIVPTETGLEVYDLVKGMAIADVAMTGRWEIALSMIADGKMQASDFDSKIRTFTGQITSQILASSAGTGFAKAAQSEAIACPLCGSPFRVWDTYAKCTNRECGLSVNRTVFGKKLGEKTIKNLVEAGKTGLVKGFVSKAGKSFDARLKREITEKDGRKYINAQLVFDDKKPQTKKPYNK